MLKSIHGIVASVKKLLGIYTPNAVVNDGADILSKTTTLTSAVDNGFLTLSCWINYSMTTTKNFILFNPSSGNGSLNLGKISPPVDLDTFGFFVRRLSDNALTFRIQQTAPTPNTWHHFILSIDMNNQAGSRLFIDNIEQTISWLDFIATQNIEWTIFNSNGIMDQIAGGFTYIGDISELYLTNEYVDLSVQANREKFISATGKPVDLGSNGSTPTGTQPLVYFKGAATDWNAGTNAGSGGNFTMTGAVTDSTNEPVELPKQAVTFDGTNDYLKSTSLTGAVDGKTGTISFWMNSTNIADLVLERLFWFGPAAPTMHVTQNTSGAWMTISIANAAGTSIWSQQTALDMSNNTWYHVMFSFDLSTTTTHMYVNDTSSKGITNNAPTNDTVDWTVSDYIIGASNTFANKYTGDVAELYITDEYLDLSIVANRRKFISSAGTGAKPVDLGTDGSTPTGTQPIVYFTGSSPTWNAGTNAGSGGNFTMTGAVTDSINEPVQLP